MHYPYPYPYPYQVALTNMELLRLLPWRKGPTLYDGLPDKRLMLRVWLQVMLLEDVPQFTIQVSLCPSLYKPLPYISPSLYIAQAYISPSLYI